MYIYSSLHKDLVFEIDNKVYICLEVVNKGSNWLLGTNIYTGISNDSRGQVFAI